MTCILCAIADGHEPAKVAYEDIDCMAIAPLKPIAPVHVLLFLREHAADLPTYLANSSENAAHLMRRAAALACDLDLSKRGYRLAWNFGPDTNQRIMHPHLHLLGGARLSDRLG